MKNLLVLLLLSPLTVFANDGISALAAGGIEFRNTKDVKLNTELLTISTEQVTVKYEFFNASAKDVTTLVAFPLPKITCGYWGRNETIGDFSAIVDGKAVKLRMEEKAFQYSKKAEIGPDITAKVKAAGLPIDCRKVNSDKSLFKKAQKAKLADDFKGEDPEDIRYVTQIIYYWEQTFPSLKKVNIEHAYKPVLGMEGSGVAEGYLNRSMSWDRDIHQHAEGNPPYMVTDVKNDVNVEYILTTAKTWSGPIGDFTLVIKRKSPEIHVGSTLGPLTKVDDNTLTFRATKFVPDRDLLVIFGK